MKILIACEFSGIVRDAFTKKGHDVISCDLRPTFNPGKHYQGDVMDILYDGWDMLIGFPPCTYLSFVANNSWYSPGRWQKRLSAIQFFAQLWSAPIDKICLENPQGIITNVISKPSQIINPYYFGTPERKRTCLWLKNLPLLYHSPVADLFYPGTHTATPEPTRISPNGSRKYFVDANDTKSTRELIRCKTFQSIANAMSDQWC